MFSILSASHRCTHISQRNKIICPGLKCLFQDLTDTVSLTSTKNQQSLRKMSSWNHTINVDNLNPCIKNMEYAVRGPLVIRATEIEKEILSGVQKPFPDVIKANIGDAHAMGNAPIKFLRQVLALVTYPELLDSPDFPEDAKKRARDIRAGCKNGSVGSYSDSAGIEIIRRHVVDYIEKRDGGIKSDWTNVILCAGASEGIRAIMKLLTNPFGETTRPGVMIPIPQYPLYSASLAEYNMTQIGYYLNEAKNWTLDVSELERSITDARKKCNPRAIVIINPGNPTGQVLARQTIEDVIKFAYKEKLFIFADEVYQDNVYAEGSAFHSFKKVLFEMGDPYDKMELASFMSCSKGYMGECGIRGGYTEIVNFDPQVKAMLLKSVSAKLCPTAIGQACMDVVVNPPVPGEPSYEEFEAQKKQILEGLAEKAKLVADTFNSIEGFSCNIVQGAMYAFPQLHLPPKAIAKAEELGQKADVFYAFQLLENTGICIIPGSGFGQVPDTYHFRTTILPQKKFLINMLDRLKEFHLKFLKEYS
ncbi:alanine aminotransferase 1 isoform X2 [Lepeophtheirus salmonis]|nr:alanine aminotransferase 1-like isoform X2 [Lepeophtheirus salmonis]XP_040583627.1 alanine aminotransferase 1-like isoform X2 [Lepeophtheirus salmonis]XP_040583628.1 alanine aminotransferase 1-like isoform X2 [Lepeophtheirus salmonis]XP_040583629.1 alanine aminotransferase 1-like isoform X2 [Lepeophtheirus salmonis]